MAGGNEHTRCSHKMWLAYSALTSANRYWRLSMVWFPASALVLRRIALSTEIHHERGERMPGLKAQSRWQEPTTQPPES